MGIRIRFDTDAIAIPGGAMSAMDRASVTDVKVLLTLCARRELCAAYGDGESITALADAAGCTRDEVREAVAFWRGVGVLDMGTGKSRTATRARKAEGSTSAKEVSDVPEVSAPTVSEAPTSVAAETAATRKPAPKSELPRYTTEELTALLEERKDAAAYLDECQNLWGKMFNTHEINMILGLVDYLGLDWEYVLILLAYCLKTQEARGIRKSLRYVETMAFGFYDEGVCDVTSLHEKIKQSEQMAEVEGQLRTLFGMGGRALTPAEKKYFAAWLYEYKYGMDVIRRAYEVTVDTKGSFNIRYMNSVLANWNKDGLRTVEDVERADAAFRAENEKKRAASNGGGRKGAPAADGPASFDVDDFFAAAVRRSFGDEDPNDA